MVRRAVRKLWYWFSDNVIKLFAVVLVAGLVFADFLAMKNLFQDLYLMDYFMFGEKRLKMLSEANVYSLTFAVLLEGTPFFMGLTLSTWLDKTKYKINDRLNAKVGFWVSFSGFFLTLIVMWVLRGILLYHNGGWNAFVHKQYGAPSGYNEHFIAQVYLLVSPVLTSILSFVASWVAFRSESITKLEYRLEKLHSKYLIAQSRFLDAVHRNDDARTALWGSLTAKDKIPSDLDTFRKECFDRIRSKLISNCIEEFPDQVQRYNADISSSLQKYISIMAQKTTSIPMDIESLTIDDVLSEYDQGKKPQETWNYDCCGESLGAELKAVLNNAVVIAQFKTTTKPYHMEGDY